MKIRKIAELLVNEYSFESPGSEMAQVAVEREEKELRQTLEQGWDKIWYVKVPVDVEY